MQFCSYVMPRPSRNVDLLLMKAGRELLPTTGLRALSIRQITERAGVNLGLLVNVIVSYVGGINEVRHTN